MNEEISSKENKTNNIDDIISDLETINDDFIAEVKREEEKKNEEERKKAGIDDEKKEDIDLKPLVDNNQLDDIKNLNSDNITDFLKKNGKVLANDKKKEDKEQLKNNKEIIFNNIDILENFNLDKDLWNDLNLDNETLEKINIKVKIEIKNFLRKDLLLFLNKILK